MAPSNEEEIDAIYEGEGPGPGSEPEEEIEDEQPEVAEASGESDEGVPQEDAVAVVIAPTDAPAAEEVQPAAPADDMEARLAARAAELDAREQNLKRWEGRLKAADKGAAEPAPEAAQEVAEAADEAVDDVMSRLESEFAENWGPDAPSQVRALVEPLITSAMAKLYEMVRGEFEQLGGVVSNMHNDAIEDAMEETGVGAEDLQAFIGSLSEEAAEKARDICMNGTFAKCVRLLKLAAKSRDDKAAEAAPAPEPAAEQEAEAMTQEIEDDPFEDEPTADPASAPIRIPDRSSSDPVTEEEIDDIYG